MFNEFTILGNLTRDPEIDKKGSDNLSVCKFGVAVNRPGKGEQKKEANFFQLTAFGKTAETVAQYKKKGDLVLVKGRLQHDRWEDKESGDPRSRIELIAERVVFLPNGRKAQDAEKAAAGAEA